MYRFLAFPVFVLLAFCVSAPADQGQKITVHARGVWPFAAGGKEFIVRSPAELVAVGGGKKGDDAEAKAVAEVAKALKVKDIDWKMHMLVVIRLDRVHPFYLGGVRQVEVGGKAATVHYSYYRPVAARPQDKAPTPVAYSFMALVDRFDGEVQFEAEERSPR